VLNTALLIARVLLALVSAVAGAANLADREGSRQAIIDFGLPSFVASPLGVLLPLAELAGTIALIPASTPLWAGAKAGASASTP
jgi:uncharacterized membrane protein YphA (DoxX/SURF4 family)